MYINICYEYDNIFNQEAVTHSLETQIWMHKYKMLIEMFIKNESLVLRRKFSE